VERLTLRLGGIGADGGARIATLVAEGLAAALGTAQTTWSRQPSEHIAIELPAAPSDEPEAMAREIVTALMVELVRRG
jgi:hypothetical protein